MNTPLFTGQNPVQCTALKLSTQGPGYRHHELGYGGPAIAKKADVLLFCNKRIKQNVVIYLHYRDTRGTYRGTQGAGEDKRDTEVKGTIREGDG